jgi:hypothetical protein
MPEKCGIVCAATRLTVDPMRSWPGIALAPLVLGLGCSKPKPAPALDQGWSVPIAVSQSKDGLVGEVVLHKWKNGIIALQGLDEGSAKCFLFNRDGETNAPVIEVPLTGVPKGYLWAYPTLNRAGDEVFFEQGYMENDRLVMKVLIGRMIANGSIAIREAREQIWITDKESLLGDTSSNVRLNDPGKRDWPSFGSGFIDDPTLHIPYCLTATTVTSHRESGPFNNGVFHSSDAGATWQMERISTNQAFYPALCKTKDYYYYFAASLSRRRGQGFELWHARKPVDGGSWNTPKAVTKYFCDHAANQTYSVEAVGDTVHVCWLDRRHEKRRFNPVYPQRENYEIAYRNRKDADRDWSEDIILSSGLLYSYAPNMSAEADRIVVAWAGVERDKDGHGTYSPNDIFFVSTKDSGKTWTKPLKVTNVARDGITCGKPKVMLLNGVIHLFYIRGTRESQGLSPGLTKLNQPPWPIYYQQRPFPD